MTDEHEVDTIKATLEAARKKAGELSEAAEQVSKRIAELQDARTQHIFSAIGNPSALARAAELRDEIAAAEGDFADLQAVLDVAIKSVLDAEKALAQASSDKKLALARDAAAKVLDTAVSADDAARALIEALAQLKSAGKELLVLAPQAAASSYRSLNRTRLAQALHAMGLGEHVDITPSPLPISARPISIAFGLAGYLSAAGLISEKS